MDVTIAIIKALRSYLGAHGAQWDSGRGTHWGGQTGLNVKALVLLQQGIIVRSRGLRVRLHQSGSAQKARAVWRTEVATLVSENTTEEGMNGTL